MIGSDKWQKSCVSLRDPVAGQYFNSKDWMDFYWTTGGFDYLYYRCSQSDMSEKDLGDNYCNEAKRADSYKECRDRKLTRGEKCCFGQSRIKGETVKEDFCISYMTADGKPYNAKQLYDKFQAEANQGGFEYTTLYFKCDNKDEAGQGAAFGLKVSAMILGLVALLLF